MKDSLANRYASALYSLAKDKDKIDQYHQEIKNLRSLILENTKIVDILKSEFLSIEKRKDIISDVFKGFSLDIISFLKVIIENNRANELINILNEFNSICNESKGIKEGILYSAFELDNKQIESVENAISKNEEAKVELVLRIDPSLIGGVKVVIGSKVYDGSILAKLSSLADNLKKGGTL